MDDVTRDDDTKFSEEPLAYRGRGDARGGLARRRTLEDVACVVAIVLEQTRKVRVSGTHACHRAPARRGAWSVRRRAWSVVRRAGFGLGIRRRGVHDLLPVFPIAIVDQHGD